MRNTVFGEAQGIPYFALFVGLETGVWKRLHWGKCIDLLRPLLQKAGAVP